MKWPVTVLALLMGCWLCAVPAANASSETHSDTAAKVCEAVQKPEIEVAADLLSNLLPEKYRPPEALKFLIKIGVKLCPFRARRSIEVGQFLVHDKFPTLDPYISAPQVSLVAGNSMDAATGGASVLANWFGLGKITKYQTYITADGTSSGSLFAPGTTAFNTVLPGHSYQYFVRGLNSKGSAVTNWARSNAFRMQVFDTYVNYGGWKFNQQSNAAYRGTLLFGGVPNIGDITYTADGFAVALVAPIFPKGGQADIYVDKHFVRRISLYSSTVKQAQLVFSAWWPTDGHHLLTLRPISGEIDLDAGLVLQRT